MADSDGQANATWDGLNSRMCPGHAFSTCVHMYLAAYLAAKGVRDYSGWNGQPAKRRHFGGVAAVDGGTEQSHAVDVVSGPRSGETVQGVPVAGETEASLLVLRAE